MNISQLGSLTPHARFPDWLVSGPVAVPYFDGLQLPFTLEGFTEADQAETQAAMDAFFALGNDARLRTSGHVFANYRHMADVVGEDDLGCHIDTAEAVWPHVYPTEVFVARRHRRERAVYVQLLAECDWEQEHGLQIVYRRGAELVRVSEQDGRLTLADGADLPEDQDRMTE